MPERLRKMHLAAIFYGLLAVLATGFIWFKLSGGELLSVQTGSMVPAVNKGDLVAVTRVPESRLAIGDVVTYQSPLNKDQTITHRIVELPSDTNEYKFLTKGDANPAPDIPIAYERILGREMAVIPFAGYGFNFARQPIGLALLIYVPALLIIGSEVRRLRNYYKTREPYYASNAIKKRLLERRQQLS